MTYYRISIGFNHWKYGSEFSCEETTAEEYNKFLRLNHGFNFELTSNALTWDLVKQEGSGYIIGFADENNLDSIKAQVINKAWDFSDSVIIKKELEIEQLNSTIDRLYKHPIYKMVLRDKKIDEILN